MRDEQGPFSFNDIGCGYGALAAYLHSAGVTFHYHGFDLSSEMIRLAREHYGILRTAVSHPRLKPWSQRITRWPAGSSMSNSRPIPEQWRAYMLDTIDQLAALSTRGFAFNVLTSYADPERMRPDLYYADPCFLFDYCQRRYSRWVAVLHDYGLYEFTLLVRKERGALVAKLVLFGTGDIAKLAQEGGAGVFAEEDELFDLKA